MVAHEKADMARMQDPTEGFCEGTRGVDDARDVGESDFTKGTPLLEAKIADSNVARTGGGAIVVDDLDGGIVVFPNIRRVGEVETEVLQDHANVFHDFGSSIGSDQLSFGHVLSRDRLSFGAVSNNATGNGTAITGSGPHVSWDISKCHIDIHARFKE